MTKQQRKYHGAFFGRKKKRWETVGWDLPHTHFKDKFKMAISRYLKVG